MESRAVKIQSKKNPKISINIIPGHFVTNHSHINYYIDMTIVKHKQNLAHAAGKELAEHYRTSKIVDTIVCMDGCEIIGAFMADELTKSGIRTMNENSHICVITPEYNSNGQMIFRDNIQSMVWGKNIVLLIASATTGKTINRSLECIRYYGGEIAGISAIFSATTELHGHEINMLFHQEDLPDYKTYPAFDCPFCKEKQKIDAIVNSFGYSKI